MTDRDLATRAARHAALGDPARLAIVDELIFSDRSPVELRHMLGIESNLLAHHLDVLEQAGMIARSRSSGDRRRRYVHVLGEALDGLVPSRPGRPGRALFVCTRNSARSQLAAALWESLVQAPAESAGTSPAERVHPGAVAAARRAGVPMTAAQPRSIDDVGELPELVVTVCDQAHEAIGDRREWLHWSILDPVSDGTAQAFDAALQELRDRIRALVAPRPAAIPAAPER